MNSKAFAALFICTPLVVVLTRIAGALAHGPLALQAIEKIIRGLN